MSSRLQPARQPLEALDRLITFVRKHAATFYCQRVDASSAPEGEISLATPIYPEEQAIGVPLERLLDSPEAVQQFRSKPLTRPQAYLPHLTPEEEKQLSQLDGNVAGLLIQLGFSLPPKPHDQGKVGWGQCNIPVIIVYGRPVICVDTVWLSHMESLRASAQGIVARQGAKSGGGTTRVKKQRSPSPKKKRSPSATQIAVESVLYAHHFPGAVYDREVEPLQEDEIARKVGRHRTTISRQLKNIFPPEGLKRYKALCRSGRLEKSLTKLNEPKMTMRSYSDMDRVVAR